MKRIKTSLVVLAISVVVVNNTVAQSNKSFEELNSTATSTPFTLVEDDSESLRITSIESNNLTATSTPFEIDPVTDDTKGGNRSNPKKDKPKDKKQKDKTLNDSSSEYQGETQETLKFSTTGEVGEQLPEPSFIGGDTFAVDSSLPASTSDSIDTDDTPAGAAVDVVGEPMFVDDDPESSGLEAVFPPDNAISSAALLSASEDSQSEAVAASSLDSSCQPVEYGSVSTTAKTIPEIAIIAVFEPPFPVSTGKTKEITEYHYSLAWLAPMPSDYWIENTIEGKDVDGDCVRDDIERYIYNRYSGWQNISKRKYLFEYAKWLQLFLVNNLSVANAVDIRKTAFRAYGCSIGAIGSSASDVLRDIFIELHNTKDRAIRRFERMGLVSGYHSRDLGDNSCVF